MGNYKLSVDESCPNLHQKLLKNNDDIFQNKMKNTQKQTIQIRHVIIRRA